MRRSSLEEGLRWLEQAQEDLKWAQDLAQRVGTTWRVFSPSKLQRKL